MKVSANSSSRFIALERVLTQFIESQLVQERLKWNPALGVMAAREAAIRGTNSVQWEMDGRAGP